jgi:endonuclease YncB( thermonuclease family)
MRLFLIGLIALAGVGGAAADPCAATLPSKAGTVFTGTVRYIVDGDGLCVGTSNDPNTWIEVRLVDFDAPELSTAEGKRGGEILEQLAMGKSASCVTQPGRSGRTTTYDRVLAACEINGVSLSRLLTQAKAPTGGN